MLEIQQKENMDKYIEVLKNCRLFEGIPHQSLSALIGWLNGQIKKYSKNEVVFAEGKKVPDETIKVAAEIACSDFQGSQNVDYTERRNVKRMPNGHPGQVIYVNYKTALANPCAHDELKK